jgi:hypothetical protein
MAYINSNVLDLGLSWAKTNADTIYICSSEPATYTAASSTYALGSKTFGNGNVFPATIANGSPSGRKITTAAVTDGSVTGTNTVGYWAIVWTVGSALIAASSLSAQQVVTSGNTFTLTAFDIRLPGVGG